MIFVKTADLKVGMRLAKPIYNRLGVLLYDRESTLTKQAVKSVQNFGLIGLYILEPAEPAPPISPEEIEFERFQTIYVFRIKEVMDEIMNNKAPTNLHMLTEAIIRQFGNLDHPFPFTQNLRSHEDYHYKHSLNVAILCTMMCYRLELDYETCYSTVTAALLHDVGMLTLPEAIMDKPNPELKDEDVAALNRCLQLSYQLLSPSSNPYDLPSLTLRILDQTSRFYYHPDFPKENINWIIPSMILLVANAFDNLTAMRLQDDPVSLITAVRYLRDYPEFYDRRVLNALIDSIAILPRGCCVELSNGKTGMVIAENLDNFLAPVVLQFSNNHIIDLDDPAQAERYQIVEIMRTMDNRIKIDEQTLAHFNADSHLTKTLEKMKRQRSKKGPVRTKK